MYKIVGNDSKVYGPATAETLRAWLSQGRLESRTPVLPEGATEWTTIGLLPEFSRECGTLPPVMVPPKAVTLPPAGTNGFATAGLVCGLVSWCACCCCGGFPFNLLGLVFSIIAMVQINSQTPKQAGWGLALAGIILSALSLLGGIGIGLAQLLTEPHRVNFHYGSI